MRAKLVIAFLIALLAACAGGSPKRYQAYDSPAAEAEADSDYGGGSYDAPAHAGTSGGDSVARTETRRNDRPGLGTVWGEDLTSSVQSTPFERDSESPFATLGIYYNDSEGVEAHADYRGSVDSIYARTPHGGISVSLTDANGNVLPGLVAAGKTLVVGREGDRYNIVVENLTGGRFEVVATVDGLDVIDGRAGDLRKRGYILNPNDRVVIDGFRRSDSTVAAFRFGAVGESYAARTSGDRNVGVIGVAFFAEQGSVWTDDEIRKRDTASPFPGDRTYAAPPR
jgi:hypothetical protein